MRSASHVLYSIGGCEGRCVMGRMYVALVTNMPMMGKCSFILETKFVLRDTGTLP